MSRTLTSDEYLVPAEAQIAEIKIKGSRFIATIEPVKSKTEAEEVYASFRKKYYDATHNCFAYRINADDFRYSDDGEPSGTAGKPIFQVLGGNDIHQALCVVTRYFGGTKLGTGGLIRAYSDAANEALNKLKLKTLVRTHQLNLFFTYDFENLLRNLINEYHGRILNSDYSDKVQMQVAIPQSKTEQFMEIIKERSNSMVQISQV